MDNDEYWVKIAKRFHDTYEKLAPSFGYETREDTKEFDEESANGKLMIAVCKEVIEKDRQVFYRELNKLNEQK